MKYTGCLLVVLCALVSYELSLPFLSHAQQANPPAIEKGQGDSPFTVFDASEKEELIFRLAFGRETLSEGIIVYSDRDGVFVSLDELSRILELAISVDPAQGQAEGWFLGEARRFFLDVTKSVAVVEGRQVPFDSQFVWVGGDDIYVHTSLYSTWFPVDFEIDLSQLLMTVSTREPFPFQERLEREQRRKQLRRQGRTSPDYPNLEYPFQWLGWPAFDVGSSANYSSQSDRITSRYSAVMGQDLFNMSSISF